jgi:uncharacterized protein (UPF0297 family)
MEHEHHHTKELCMVFAVFNVQSIEVSQVVQELYRSLSKKNKGYSKYNIVHDFIGNVLAGMRITIMAY